MRSLFDRLTRHSYNPRRNPQEERLTEAFAATLEAAPDAAAQLVKSLRLTSSKPDTDLQVTTQRPAGGGRVDVELRFGTHARPELVVWLELKCDAPPDGDQLWSYARALTALPYRTELALITRRDAVFPEAAPGRHGTWQEVGRALDQWWRDADRSEPDAHATAMVREFVDYLEEVQLAAINALDVTDVLALSAYPTAAERMNEVVTLASRDIAVKWSPCVVDGQDKPEWQRDNPLDFWRTYAFSADVPWPESYWLEFNAGDDENRPQARGEAAFGAGASTRLTDALNDAYHSAWIAELERLGFEYSHEGGDDGYRFLFRYLYPAELLVYSDLHEQAGALARWVLETFELISSQPPAVNPP